MSKKKIFNDPIYGFISYPFEILYELIDHSYFQRLRRITQLGLSHYVYPGAIHTRFHHALGALHLMVQAIETLKSKDVTITDAEAEAVCIAILLHDIGHGPFSHALEFKLVNTSHESLSIKFMEILNEEFDGRLDLAIAIFTKNYHKNFLHDLVSSQLDMDRLDYLNRDSFFTGVAEGVIGYNRIIKMLNVVDDQLVVEEKGIYSIEKFLVARRIMYWQVYLHKTVVSAEQMLISAVNRAAWLCQNDEGIRLNPMLKHFLSKQDSEMSTDELKAYNQLDDIDIINMLKLGVIHKDFVFRYLCKSLVDRNLFRIKFQKEEIESSKTQELLEVLEQEFDISRAEAEALILSGKESNQIYSGEQEPIKILLKYGGVKSLADVSDNMINTAVIHKNFLCYPRF